MKGKKVVALLLTLCFVLSMWVVPASAADMVAEGKCGTNLTWVLDEDGVLTISGSGEMYDYTSGNKTPWFSQYKQIKSVVIEDGVTGVIVPRKDYMAAADAIEKFIHNRELVEKMGKAGRERVCRLYNWDENVQQMISIYNKMA
jgi:hypothetical protein